MNTILLVLILLTCITLILRWYEPKIDVVVLTNHYQVYLWHNSYDEGRYIGRKYIKLFEI